jgi:hypothetical protein
MKMEKGNSTKKVIHNIKPTSMMLSNIGDEITNKMLVGIVFHAQQQDPKSVK